MSAEKFYKLLHEGRNILLTGPGGTGKTWLLKKVIEEMPHNFVLSSSTGISAQNLDERARTIHSLVGMGTKSNDDFTSVVRFKAFVEQFTDDQKYLIEGLKKLILDEVSMMHPSQIDLIDRIFKYVRGNDLPFGGVQMIFVGDFCLKNGTKVIMADGSLLNIEEIEIGDLVMGVDFKPRKVIKLFKGRSQLYKIHQTNGEDYYTTGNHKLMLKRGADKERYKDLGDNVVITTKEMLDKSQKFRDVFFGYKVGCINLPKREVKIDPYFLGIWLGDGESSAVRISTPDKEIMEYCENIAIKFGLEYKTRREKPDSPCFRISITNPLQSGKKNKILDILREYDLLNNKHIPDDYLLNSVDNRLQLLAGLLDTDGNWSGNRFSFCATPLILAQQVKQLADHLGFRASLFRNSADTSWIVTIGGDTWRIPTKIKRKKSIKRELGRSRMISSLTVSEDINGDYSGIEIEGDKVFLLGDGTVTHNCQLPPVVKHDELNSELQIKDKNGMVEFKKIENQLAFESDAWKSADIQTVQLTEIKRTDNLEFAQLLCRIRTMDWTGKDFKILKSTEDRVFPSHIRPVKLFNSNKKADAENIRQLDLLPPDKKNPEKVKIKFKSRGEWAKILELKKSILAVDELQLKVGCRVMIIINRSEDYINHPDITYVNGSLGVYLGLEKRWTTKKVMIEERCPVTFEVLDRYLGEREYHVMKIQLDTGPIIYLKRKTWEMGDHYENAHGKLQAEAEYSQFPVRLAYAFTIHKSQGMSIDSLEIDAHGIRTDNQFYVAVSRARTFEGLKIINLKSSNITACPKAMAFYKESLQ